jgi:hypothetical protein
MFQYKSNDTNFTQYNQVLVALFIRSNFALKCACVLFLKTEVVLSCKIQSVVTSSIIVIDGWFVIYCARTYLVNGKSFGEFL